MIETGLEIEVRRLRLMTVVSAETGVLTEAVEGRVGARLTGADYLVCGRCRTILYVLPDAIDAPHWHTIWCESCGALNRL